MNLANRWHAYWNTQVQPHHRSDTTDHYAQYGAELRLLWFGAQPQKVLEIGCGNGALYSHLGFESADYTGVDYSQSMLDDFRRRQPALKLICGDGASYRDTQQYDLIFSNGVIQYFDGPMLRGHLQQALSMLQPGGRIVWASVPWRALKLEFYRGGALMGAARRRSVWRAQLMKWASSWKKLQMGYWYELDTIRDLAAEHNCSAQLFGSLHYLYRFHAVLMRNP